MLLLTDTWSDLTRIWPELSSYGSSWLIAAICVLPLIIGFVIDFFAGDPLWLPHPIRLIGWLITKFELLLYPADLHSRMSSRRLYLRRGLALAVLVPLIIGGVTCLLLLAAWNLHFFVGFILETVLCWLIIAARSLAVETEAVQTALEAQNLGEARKRLSWLVGRDTAELSAEEVAKAAVETTAENTTDGVVAPLLFMALFGAGGGMLYKSINTIDSMIGYKNERYLYFGRAGAIIDDLANFLPSRLAALLMLPASGLLGFSMHKAWNIFRRDRLKHLSPNSAQTESVCAGALGIQLGGAHFYGGRIVDKPTIGDLERVTEPEDITRANKLMKLTSFFALLLAITLRLLLFYAIIWWMA